MTDLEINSTEQWKIVKAILVLETFTINQLAAGTGLKLTTVKEYIGDGQPYTAYLTHRTLKGHGSEQPPKQYTLTPEGKEELEDALNNADDFKVEPSSEDRQPLGDSFYIDMAEDCLNKASKSQGSWRKRCISEARKYSDDFERVKGNILGGGDSISANLSERFKIVSQSLENEESLQNPPAPC